MRFGRADRAPRNEGQPHGGRASPAAPGSWEVESHHHSCGPSVHRAFVMIPTINMDVSTPTKLELDPGSPPTNAMETPHASITSLAGRAAELRLVPHNTNCYCPNAKWEHCWSDHTVCSDHKFLTRQIREAVTSQAYGFLSKGQSLP